MIYYLGAYYLLKLKALDFGKFKGQEIWTGSTCLNKSYFDAWSLSWTEDGMKNLSEPKKEFGVSLSQIKEIQKWSDAKFNEKHLGWVNTFNNIETLIEYKTKFFNSAKDSKVIGVYFPENVIQDIQSEFKPQTEQSGTIGILDCLKQEMPERSEGEIFIGYDLIGIEFSGSYHSFHCYGNAEELIDKFDLTLNDRGLINEFERKEEIVAYVNNPDHGFPFIPWYLVKVKEVEIGSA